MSARYRFILLVALGLLLATVGAVGSATVLSAPAAAYGASVAGSTEPDHVLGVRRAGPYRIGARLDRLLADGLIFAPAPIPDRTGRMVATSAVRGNPAAAIVVTSLRGDDKSASLRLSTGTGTCTAGTCRR